VLFQYHTWAVNVGSTCLLLRLRSIFTQTAFSGGSGCSDLSKVYDFPVLEEGNGNSLGFPLENEEIIRRRKNVSKTLQAAHF